MPQNKKLILLIGIMLVLALLISGIYTNSPKSVSLLPQISTRLSWAITANQAGFITAHEKGYYTDEGIAVTNNPGGLDFPSIQLVASGTDDFGVQAGAEALITARAQGIPVKAIAVLDTVNPYVFYSLKSKNIQTPKDFEGKTIAVSYGRPLEIAYRMLLKNSGINANTITEVKKSPSDASLFAGQVDVQPGFIGDYIFAEAVAQKNNIELSAIKLSDLEIPAYGYVIFTTDKMIAEQPDLVEKYLRATLRGWNYALNNPEEVADYILKYDATLDRAAQIKSLEIRKAYIIPENGSQLIGRMDRRMWDSIQKTMIEQGILKQEVSVDDLFTNEFVEKINLSQ